MIGGGLKLQKLFKEPKMGDIINLSIMVILILLIRSYIVQVTYNMMWPKIVKNTGGDDSQFRPITFYEAIMIVLLFSFLFKG
jgi:hypothetical protein|tara:strand:- start:2044 stop:2289 length:246 start_codon:yes stop_codon:yes gene_type:complete